MMATTSDTPLRDEQWCPVAYLSIQDAAARASIVSILERAGWTVMQERTGFHLLQAIAGMIEGHHAWVRPQLIVIDAWSRGCSGATIASGLRDLGIKIPIVLIASPGTAPLVPADPTIPVVDTSSAATVIGELAGAHSAVARISRPMA